MTGMYSCLMNLNKGDNIIMIKFSPSILSADFMNLGKEIKILENENVPYIHIDVMDGMFVPNISMGMPIIKSIRKFTDLILDVHLMVYEPERYIDDFVYAGADIINIHKEACKKPAETLKNIRKHGKSPAITINPLTPYQDVLKYLDLVDMVLVMSVEPGFGGQKFIYESLSKVEGIANYIKINNLDVEIEIDGGINSENVKMAIDAGADIIVIGSSVFDKEDKVSEIRKYNKIFKEYKV